LAVLLGPATAGIAAGAAAVAATKRAGGGCATTDAWVAEFCALIWAFAASLCSAKNCTAKTAATAAACA
jgi:hypothetical protein